MTAPTGVWRISGQPVVVPAAVPDMPDPRAAGVELLDIISHAIDNAPRSQQVQIGPSELGTPCDWCLVHKLAGAPERHDGSSAWLPAIGTAVHAWLDDVFCGYDLQTYKGIPSDEELPEPRWWRETLVDVGEVNGTPVTGHADLYDGLTGDVTDWKIVGASTIKAAKANGPSETYRRQAHLYGRGFTRRGLAVRNVRIAYLPRTSVNLRDAYLWTEPYDESVALAALARADAYARAIAAVGLDKLAPSLIRAPGCYSCSSYPNADGTAPAKPGDWRNKPVNPANPFAS
jgi:hypothetical protein